MPIWEYLILETAFKTERANIRLMNDYGAKGWELTAAFPTPDAASMTMYFKRPVLTIPEAPSEDDTPLHGY